VLEVAVAVDEGLRLGEAAAVDDAGVVELVREDDLVALCQGGNDTAVGEVAGAEHQRRLRSGELGQAALELAVRRHRARDQP